MKDLFSKLPKKNLSLKNLPFKQQTDSNESTDETMTEEKTAQTAAPMQDEPMRETETNNLYGSTDKNSASSKTSAKHKTKQLTKNLLTKLKNAKALLLILLALVQLAAPIYLAHAWNTVLTEGETFRFAIKATEYPDIRHGRYAYLSLEEDHAPFKEHIKRGDTVYAVLDKSKFGLAHVLEVRLTPPIDQTYVKAKVYDIRGGEAYLEYPFARYYLTDEEVHHLEVEALKDKMQYTVTVKIKEGDGVAEKLNFRE